MNIFFRLTFLCLVATCFSTSLPVCSAGVIYDATATDVNIVGNNFNLASNTLTGSTGALVLTTVAAPNASVPGNISGNNNASGLASVDNIDTLNGTPLLATDTVTMKLGVTSSDHNFRANGLEFGLSPDGTGFRPTDNLMFQIDADNDASGMSINGITSETINAAGWAVTEASLGDGFCVTLVADSAGYTFTLTDIEEFGNLTNTTLSFGGTFAGTEFIDNFGGGHIYYTAQGSNGTASTTISEFSIDVTSAIPEPSSVVLISLGAVGFFVRRRR